MVSYRPGPDRAWLEKALADADREQDVTWRIVVVHHSPWSSGPHGDNKAMWVAGIPELLRKHKVDLVLGGHDHIYERGFADGTAYIVTGGGGAPLYHVKTPRASARKFESSHQFVDASVTDASIQIVATRADGSTIERCGLRAAGGGWDCDGDAAKEKVGEADGRSTPASASGNADSAPPANASRCACRAAGFNAGSVGPPFLATALATILLFVRRKKRTIAR
jgi:3',5'-cyclic AMP phosphodiesterase CpdA